MPTDAPDPGAAPPGHEAFSLLARGVQHQLWRMKWTELRQIQTDAIKSVMLRDGHLIIAAETASGKTEAAFLPILSRISEEPLGSVRALYVGPLKALINDQFARVEDLCGHLDMPVHRWHGDVGDTQKRRLVEAPGGVLLITPESIESLFVNRSSSLMALFGGLRFVVVDELHSFLGSDRGLHLQSLLSRLALLRTAAQKDAQPFRLVGLSATLGDFDVARRYLAPDEPDRVEIIRDQGSGKEIKYRIHCYEPEAPPASPPPPRPVEDDAAPDGTNVVERRIAADIVGHFSGKAGLIFANAKSDVEVYADLANETARERSLPESFLVHHGSLSKEIREETEQEMKSGRAMTTFCSSTLEMGIDIGSVAVVGQIGPPWSVASLAQRLGRSGRKEGQPRVMRMYVEASPTNADSDLLDPLQLDLVQAIALTELMLQKWVEPPNASGSDLSTLSHQIISVIAQTGGMRADRLHDRLCVRGAFRSVDTSLFAALLRCLAAKEVVEQTPEGDLILGLAGERIRAHKSFYAVFPTPEEYRIVHDGKQIGALPMEGVPAENDHLLFAGRRWHVVGVDQERLEILVIPARGKKRPIFLSGAGAVHTRVREKMRDTLRGADRPVYIDETAAALLTSARQYAARLGVLDAPLLDTGGKSSVWFPWAGTRVQGLLSAMLRTRGVEASSWSVAIRVPAPISALKDALRQIAASPPSAAELAPYASQQASRKYDWLLDDELLAATGGWSDGELVHGTESVEQAIA